MGEELAFDLEKVHEALNKGLIGEDDVDLSEYLTAYRELYNLFLILGGAFQFVSSDVKVKIKILADLQDAERRQSGGLEHFSAVRRMVEHEQGGGLLADTKYVSGARTLLRLHRGMDFIMLFLGEISQLPEEAYICDVCRSSYDKTLANHHTWVVRKAATVAMKLLPTKRDLVAKITKNNEARKQQMVASMPAMLAVMRQAYDRVERVYTDKDLHSLP